MSVVTQGALARLATLGFDLERRWRSKTRQSVGVHKHGILKHLFRPLKQGYSLDSIHQS